MLTGKLTRLKQTGLHHVSQSCWSDGTRTRHGKEHESHFARAMGDQWAVFC